MNNRVGKNPADYSARWESYWKHVSRKDSGAKVLWDSAPESLVQEDVDRFRPHLDEELPLLDLGCGSGRQTRLLAQHFPKMIGADLSPAAIELARQQTSAESNIEYRIFDAFSPSEADALHRELGDLNIYIRGVLLGIQRADRLDFIANMEGLLGKRGTLYQIEVNAAGQSFLKYVQCSKLFVMPVGFDNALDIEACYPASRWQVVAQGQNVAMNQFTVANREKQTIPGDYLIVRRKVSAST
ncbi:MAG: class I SAM-dependent methyltransferase [Candidatus Promineifilaceae bacterium]